MKSKLLLVFIACIFMAGFVMADEVVVPGGLANAGLLEATINADTTADGARVDPNRVYVLEANQFYFINAGINIDNLGGTLTIKGQEGGTKPVLLRQAVDEVEPGGNQVVGGLAMINLHVQDKSLTNSFSWTSYNISGENSHLTIDNCLFEFIQGQWFNMNNVTVGCEISITNSYFRNLFHSSQWWASRIVTAKVAIDELIFSNNTVTGGGLTILPQECLIDYMEINHNTIINNHKYFLLNQYIKEGYLTNNIFVNCNWVGEDFENVASGGQDPDALLHGISGVDTLENTILIQPKYLNADSSLTAEVDGLDDIIYYAADNVVCFSPEFDAWANGTIDGIYDDAPASYLTWGGVDGPFKIVSLPPTWMNERTQALVDGYDNIKDENNHVYDMVPADIGFATAPVTQAGVDVAVEWNRVQWGNENAATPEDMSAWFFGDEDPMTVPGIETEEGTGITKISDMTEDFSYTANLVSNSDGLQIGALHWFDVDYDAATSMAAVKAAFSGGNAVEETKNPVEFTLAQNYPNPFNPSTSINFNLEKTSQVNLTVYNVMGQEMATLVNARINAGSHDITWDASDMASGVYFYTMEVDNQYKVTRKMMLVK